MTSLVVERLDLRSGARGARAVELTRARATADLGGRTVWCAAGLPSGHTAGEHLRASLRTSGGGVATGPLEVTASAALRALAGRLDAMLHGARGRTERLSAADEALYAESAAGAVDLAARGVRRDDVVVLHDPVTAALALAIREHGAHAVWMIEARTPRGAATAVATLALLRPYTGGVDAYVLSWSRPAGRGGVVDRIAAVMPRADVVAAKDVPASRERGDHGHHVGWSSVLADVVDGDRGERVGGRLNARPAVPVR